MFKPNLVTGNSGKIAHYFTKEFGREDYYLNGAEPPGTWGGNGAAALGLCGEVSEEAFREILSGREPATSRQLVAIGGASKTHTCGWDSPFSAPKDVSILYARFEGNLKEKVRLCHENAVHVAIQYIEKNHLKQAAKRVKYRTGSDGKKERLIEREAIKGVICSKFEHRSSRELDPQLHTHVFFANIGQRNDGTWGAIDFSDVYKSQRLIGAIYRAELAENLKRSLGIEIERKDGAFRIKGITDELRNCYSKRREQILEEMKKRGAQLGGAFEQIVAVLSRKNKMLVNNDVLFSLWHDDFDKRGFTLKKAQSLIGVSPMERSRSFDDITKSVIAEALHDLTQTQAVFSELELKVSLAQASQGVWGKEAIERLLDVGEKSGSVVEVGTGFKGEKWFTTPEFMAAESDVKKLAAEMTSRRSIDGISHPKFDELIAKFEKIKTKGNRKKFELTSEQKTAINTILNGPDLVTVEGYAGTGKTTVMEAIKLAAQGKKVRVIGLTPTHKAAAALRESGIETETLAKAIHMEAKTRGSFIKRGDILIADEMGMVGTKEMKSLMEMAVRSQAKLVLVGDSMQLPPVSAGAPFRLIKEMSTNCSLKDVRRQRNEVQREAAVLIREGSAHEALAKLRGEGLIVIEKEHKVALDKIVSSYVADRVEGVDAKIIASTNEEVSLLNSAVRRELVERGIIARKGISYETVTNKGQIETRVFAKGDRVAIRANDKRLMLTNGMVGIVEAARRGKLHVVFTDPKKGKYKIKIPMDKFKNVDYAYAGTTYTSQGSTHDRVHFVANSRQRLGEAYVALSRQRETVKIYASHEAVADIDFSKFERRLTHEERLTIKDRNVVEKLGASFGRELEKPNVADFDRQIKLSEPKLCAEVLIDPRVRATIEELDPARVDRELVKDLRQIYITPLGTSHEYETPRDELAPWQRKVFDMISKNDYSAAAIGELKKMAMAAPLGVRPVKTESIEKAMYKRADILAPFFRDALQQVKEIGMTISKIMTFDRG